MKSIVDTFATCRVHVILSMVFLMLAIITFIGIIVHADMLSSDRERIKGLTSQVETCNTIVEDEDEYHRTLMNKISNIERIVTLLKEDQE